MLSPPGASNAHGSLSQRASSTGKRSGSSAKGTPSNAPPLISMRPSSVTMGSPAARSIAFAVSYARLSGEA